MPTNYDVIIAGLGPVGAVAAVLLAHAGLRVCAIEREEEVYALPRAVNLDGELVRQFQPLGLADELNALLQPVREGERVGFTNSQREWLFGQDAVRFGPNGWQPSNLFDQPELEGWFRSQATGHPLVTSRIGHELTSFEDLGDRVKATLENGEQLEAAYLLGCDGASSQVRKSLGIGWQDLGYNHEWLVVDVTMTGPHQLPNEVLQVCDPDRITTYVATKEPYRRWEFKLNPGETAEEMLHEETVRRLLDDWTPRDTYEIRRSAVYEFHAATAESWQSGRVFIAGDAAHQTPPFLGQGMNAGLRDVVNLAWKMKLVLNGDASPDLLATYQAERIAHAHDLVDWAVSVGQLMEHTAATEAAAREGKAAPPPPEKVKSSGYGQGRDQPPIRAGIVTLDQVSDHGVTGYLLRQPMVCTEDGTECLLDELLGSGFSILGRNSAYLETSPEHDDMISRLEIEKVDVSTLTITRGRLDEMVISSDAVIVRPDRIVYGHTDEKRSLDDLLGQLVHDLTL